MKHATPQALAGLSALLARIRLLDGLREKKSGVFHDKAGAFLHFHEDPGGLHADVKVEGEWRRFPARTSRDAGAIVGAAERALAGRSAPARRRRGQPAAG